MPPRIHPTPPSDNTNSPPSPMASRAPPPPMNPWEAQALTHSFPDRSLHGSAISSAPPSTIPRQDALIFPGLYSASGYDLMSILLQVRCRPHPVIDLGAIDCSVSLTLCDLDQPDQPIVYVSDSFLEMTGYSRHEVIGRNCRFLQTPNSSACASTAGIDRVAIRRMSQAVHSKQEIQLQIYNYKKNGQRFTNILSIIPLQIGPSRHNYAVGLQCEL